MKKYWLEDLKRKNIQKIWQDVISGKAVAISPSGGVISGDAARVFSPNACSWTVRYLDRVESWTLSNGVLEKEDLI